MPYIKQEQRDVLDKLVEDLAIQIGNMVMEEKSESFGAREGIMNYCIYKMCKMLYTDPTVGTVASYKGFNSMIGMMECCKLELSRRLVNPYEDEKIISNGDV